MNVTIGESGGKPVKIDLEVLLRTRLLIQANSGGGKSWALRRLAEQLFGKIQVILVDPEGEFATLREKYGYVLVGAGGETPADPRSAAMVAHKLLELHASTVCDLFEMKPMLRHQWVRLFLDSLIDAPKKLWHPTVVIVDEAAMFCPEKGAGESEASESMISLATRGRKRGFCAVWACQRLGNLRKDAAAQMLNVLIGPTFIDVDRKRAAGTLGIAKDEVHAFFDRIKVLDPGNFFALGTAITKERLLVKIGTVETHHPETGSSRYSAAPPPPPEAIRDLLPKLSDLPRQAEEKAKTEAELRQEIRSLKAQVRAAAGAADNQAVAEALQEAEKWKKQAKDAASRHDRLRRAAEGVLQRFQAIFDTNPAPESKPPVRELTPLKDIQLFEPKRTSAPRQEHNSELGELTGPERKILAALAQFEAIGRTQPKRPAVAALASYSHRGGGFMNPLGALRSRGLVEYPAPGVVSLTEEGRAAAPHIDVPASTDEMLQRVLSILSGPERKILAAVHAAYPQPMSREDLGAATGYEPRGGAFMNPLGSLRTADMVTYPSPGQVRAADWLFLE
jgi:uncharacterized protein